MSDFPRTLFVETTTRCNLACPMCVKNAPGWQGGEGHMAWEVFERLESALPHAEAVILNGMGEPLLHPDLGRMIALTKARQPNGGWCGMQTNGLLLTEARARELVLAGLDVCCLSVDGDAASLGHGPGQEGAAARGVSLLRAAAAQRGRSIRLGAEFVLMKSNAAELPGLVDWAAGIGLDFLLVTHMLPAGPAQEDEALFHPCSGTAIAHFSRFRPRAEALGFGLGELARTALKHNRSDAEEGLLDLVREMRQGALAQGLWLDVERLDRTDFARLSELAGLFALAGGRAAETGLDLRLPGLSAPARTRERRCAFVEGRAACVDWRGNVSPCHFLWHGYECRIFGEAKRVLPTHFGNISVTPLADIWRAPDFRVFSEQVRAGEYAPCGDCATGLCSDIRGDAPFDRDCLGATVPCGHCPWAVGQLMCLGSEPNQITR